MNSNKGFIVPALIAAVVIVAGIAIYLYNQNSTLKQNPQAAAEAEAAVIIAEVGKLIVLPADEQPTIATITDPEKLKSQAFFANAKVGDKVLIYPTAKKAFLYDPVAKKLIEAAPLFIGNLPADSSSSTSTR